MKRLVFAAFLAFGTCASLPARQSTLLSFAPSPQPTAPSVVGASRFTLVPELALPAAPVASFAPLAPLPALPNAPAPRQTAGNGDDGYRWDLAVGYEFVHFKSAPFSANLSGLHTDLTYNVNEWLGLEGSLVSAFGGDVLGGERSKYVLYTGGGRIGWGPANHRWAPWAHILVGGVHVNPQVAAQSKNGFALQVGGGADWTYNSRVSLRGEVDYVRTQLYSSSQDNVQAGAGIVLHF